MPDELRAILPYRRVTSDFALYQTSYERFCPIPDELRAILPYTIQTSYEQFCPIPSDELRAILPYTYTFVVEPVGNRKSEFLPGGTKGRNA
jgi:hypothetical protein